MMALLYGVSFMTRIDVKSEIVLRLMQSRSYLTTLGAVPCLI